MGRQIKVDIRNSGLWLVTILGATLSLPGFAADSPAGANKVIEEIVVTSRRRTESVQDVPQSVTVFGLEQMDQLKPRTLRDFDGLVPNLYVGMNTAGPGASALYMRGIGYADIEKTQSPQVGVIVDGVQIGSSTGQLIDVFDVESLEVNRGPQGIYFGRNTMGGNIVVNRTRPDLQNYTSRIQVDAGNYKSTNLRGRVSVPLIPNVLALKVGAVQRNRDGYYTNLTLGGDQGNVNFASQTVALRYSPNSAFDATLTYDRIRDNSEIPPQDPRFNGDNPFQNLAGKREPTTYNVDQLALRFSWDIASNLTLYNITALNNSRDLVEQDFDGATVNSPSIPFAQIHGLRDQTYKVFTQELRVAWAATDNLDIQAGGYYFNSDLNFRQDSNNVQQFPLSYFQFAAPGAEPTLTQCSDSAKGLRAHPVPALAAASICQWQLRSTQLAFEEVVSFALFGSATWRPTDNVELSAGLRYIKDDKKLTNAYFDYRDGTFDGPDTPEFDFSQRPVTAGPAFTSGDNWGDVILAGSASYAFNNGDSRVYLSYSEGFRSGGISIRAARGAAEAPFDNEEAVQLELGVKNQFFNGRLRSSVAVFMLNRTGGQFSSIIPIPNIPGTTTIINNGGTQEVRGWEFENVWQVTDNLTLTANAGILDNTNDAFGIDCYLLDGCVTAVPGVLDPRGTLRQIGGNNDSRQPDWNYNIIAAYSRQVGPGQFFANAGYKAVSNFLLVNTGGGADQRLVENGYGQWDARLSYEVPLRNSSLQFSVFGKNLTDTQWREQALFLGGPNSGFQGWGAPRTWAVELVYDFSMGK